MAIKHRLVNQMATVLLLNLAIGGARCEVASLSDEIKPYIEAVRREHVPGGTLYPALHSSAGNELARFWHDVPHRYEHHEVLSMATAFDTATPEGQLMARGLTIGAQFENVEAIWLLSSLFCITLDWREVPLELHTRGVLTSSLFRGSLASKIYYLLNGESLPKGTGQVVRDTPLEWLKSQLENATQKWGIKHQEVFKKAMGAVEERMEVEAKKKAQLDARRQARMRETSGNGSEGAENSVSRLSASQGREESGSTDRWGWAGGILFVIVMGGVGWAWIRRTAKS